MTQLAHCLVTLCRLSTFEHPVIPWDCKRIRRERDLGEFVRKWCEVWERIPEEAGLVLDAGENEMSAWLYTSKKLEPIAKWWDLFMAAEAEKEALENNPLGEAVDAGHIQTQGVEFPAMNTDLFMDDYWVSDIFGQGGDLFGGNSFNYT